MTETEREETRDYGAWRVPAHAQLPGRQGCLQQGHRGVPLAPWRPPLWPPQRPQGKAAVPRLLAFRMGLTLKEMIEKMKKAGIEVDPAFLHPEHYTLPKNEVKDENERRTED